MSLNTPSKKPASPDEQGAYTRHPFTLFFLQPEVEKSYRALVHERSRLFTRGAWVMAAILTTIFAALDHRMLGERGSTLMVLRVPVVVLALAMIAISFTSVWRRLIAWVPATLVGSCGLFCIAAIGLSEPATMSPYFTGLFLVLAGIFCAPGLGFLFGLGAMLLVLAALNLVAIFVNPVEADVLFAYNFFLPGGIATFGYAAYLVERTSRGSFATSAQLRESLSEVKVLSGLLPICAACKKVRDDDGYWNQIEIYLARHSEAEFSHGMCPDCMQEWYPDPL